MRDLDEVEDCCRMPRWLALVLVCLWMVALGCGSKSRPSGAGATGRTASQPVPDETGAFHVRPGERIQAALDAAAKSTHKRVIVHEGRYFPKSRGQAFLRFNRQHDGIELEAQGAVTLSAANPELSPVGDPTHPAIVNHIVYFGDGIGPSTVLRGFELTGANGFVATDDESAPIESSNAPRLERGLFYYADGGAIKVFGRSAPTLEGLVIRDNHSMLCAGGISIEQRGYRETPVVMRHCRFLRNTCPATGAAVDVLGGSRVLIEQCLFLENQGNSGMDQIAEDFQLRYNSKHGCGALTVFPESGATVRDCTFVRNWNAVDDHGDGSLYERCLFWGNDQGDGSRPGAPYELDLGEDAKVTECVVGGNDQLVLRGEVDEDSNRLGGEPPDWDARFVPRASGFEHVGYRPRDRGERP